MNLCILHNTPERSVYEITAPDGAHMSHGSQAYRTVHLGGAEIPCAFIGGIGTELRTPDADLFRAFPYRPGGVFEHF